MTANTTHIPAHVPVHQKKTPLRSCAAHRKCTGNCTQQCSVHLPAAATGATAAVERLMPLISRKQSDKMTTPAVFTGVHQQTLPVVFVLRSAVCVPHTHIMRLRGCAGCELKPSWIIMVHVRLHVLAYPVFLSTNVSSAVGSGVVS
jgi:hypothetical protein